MEKLDGDKVAIKTEDGVTATVSDKQANKQTSKQANKQTSKQANKQTSKQANKNNQRINQHVHTYNREI